jgi:probable rRNA maturation factor
VSGASVVKESPIAVHVSAEGVRIPLARTRIADLARAALRAERVKRAELSITFVDARAMARLNRQHLRHRGPTDIITFELAPAADGTVLGDVYICPEIARANAIEHGTGIREELQRLVVHGVLHAVGWEHPEDDGRTTSAMWRRQEQLVGRLAC